MRKITLILIATIIVNVNAQELIVLKAKSANIYDFPDLSIGKIIKVISKEDKIENVQIRIREKEVINNTTYSWYYVQINGKNEFSHGWILSRELITEMLDFNYIFEANKIGAKVLVFAREAFSYSKYIYYDLLIPQEMIKTYKILKTEPYRDEGWKKRQYLTEYGYLITRFDEKNIENQYIYSIKINRDFNNRFNIRLGIADIRIKEIFGEPYSIEKHEDDTMNFVYFFSEEIYDQPAIIFKLKNNKLISYEVIPQGD